MTEVNLVKKLPTDLADVKLSCETPKPSAPPSDFCNRTAIIATLFILTSITLTIMSNEELPSSSVLEKVEEKKDSSEPEIPKSD